MGRKTIITKDREQRKLTVERVVSIPLKLSWQGWTKPEHIERWWGPKNWNATVYEMDVRPGGVWRYRLAPDATGEGKEAFCKATYSEVAELSKLVYTDTFTDQDWNPVAGSDMLTSVTFEAVKDGTRLSIITHFASEEQLEAAEGMGMVEGYADTLERFENEISLYIKDNKRRDDHELRDV
ncbi:MULTISPECIES: SRPBCC domain-containing protein [unclassified Paenibacillus]|uniref:SRPBCC family protein n=1 Tax=unclassified Paenibacillus TaxID=185978 RepID=UPI0017879175|nr:MULTISPECIES: SRPBCC domain-containing protein [unclassified Paenibacillus]QOT09016.1 SRPBCC domain-containing protein [Paenibacillus sp. JNUCC-32]WFB59024.1 SRPBCC domain-containing protein [Paenibacillus sp. BR1-192]